MQHAHTYLPHTRIYLSFSFAPDELRPTLTKLILSIFFCVIIIIIIIGATVVIGIVHVSGYWVALAIGRMAIFCKNAYRTINRSLAVQQDIAAESLPPACINCVRVNLARRSLDSFFIISICSFSHFFHICGSA